MRFIHAERSLGCDDFEWFAASSCSLRTVNVRLFTSFLVCLDLGWSTLVLNLGHVHPMSMGVCVTKDSVSVEERSCTTDFVVS